MRESAHLSRCARVVAMACVLTLALVAPTATAGFDIDLTQGMWDVRGSDHARSWDPTTLNFTSQVWTGSGWELEGYFDWEASDGRFGREIFTGFLDNSLRLTIDGQGIIEPTNGGVGTSSYEAWIQVGQGGDLTIVDGVWPAPGSGSAIGSWSAFQVVPTPGAIALLGAAGLAGRRRRRRA